jgi:hypothetical protein
MSQNCFLCCEDKLIIECPSCKFGSCEECWRIWLLQNNKQICPNKCDVILSNYFIYQNFSTKWIKNVYTKHKINEYIKEFETMSQAYIKRVRISELISKLNDKKLVLEGELRRTKYCDEEKREKIIIEIKDIEKLLTFYNNFVNSLNVSEDELNTFIDSHESRKNEKKIIFYCNCPSLNCRGMISNGWTCDECGISVCEKCKSVKNSGLHKCDPHTLASNDLIEKSSKQCPKCKIYIFKIEGCNDMFCNQCYTFFKWNTLQIITDRTLHNPHFIELNNKLKKTRGDVETQTPTPACDQALFNWRLLHNSFVGRSDDNINEHKLPRYIKDLVFIVRELDMYTQDSISEIQKERILKTISIIGQYQKFKISKQIRNKMLWEVKNHSDLYLEINMVRNAWAISVKNIISNFTDKKMRKSTTGFKYEDFRQQVCFISKVSRNNLLDLSYNYETDVYPLCPLSDTRFYNVKNTTCDKEYIISFRISKRGKKFDEN